MPGTFKIVHNASNGKLRRWTCWTGIDLLWFWFGHSETSERPQLVDLANGAVRLKECPLCQTTRFAGPLALPFGDCSKWKTTWREPPAPNSEWLEVNTSSQEWQPSRYISYFNLDLLAKCNRNATFWALLKWDFSVIGRFWTALPTGNRSRKWKTFCRLLRVESICVCPPTLVPAAAKFSGFEWKRDSKNLCC